MNSSCFVLILFLALASCTFDHDKTLVEAYDLALHANHDVDKQVNLSTLAKSIRYVPLETTEEALVGTILKVVLKSGKVFISDNSRVLIFDLNGKYISKIDRAGKGPDEYGRISDFTVSEDGNTVYVLSRKKILKFNQESKVVKVIPIDDVAENLELLNNDLVYFIPTFYYTDSSKYKIKILDSLGKFKKGFKSNEVKHQPAYSMPAYFYADKSKLYFIEVCSDTAFSIDNTTLAPHLLFQLKDKLAPIELFESMERYGNEYTRYLFPGTVTETEHYIFLKYIFNDTRGCVLYDKEETKLIGSGELGKALLNDIDGIPFWPRCNEHKLLVNLYEPIDLKKAIKSNGKRNDPMTLIEVDKIKDTDNPVLQIVEMR